MGHLLSSARLVPVPAFGLAHWPPRVPAPTREGTVQESPSRTLVARSRPAPAPPRSPSGRGSRSASSPRLDFRVELRVRLPGPLGPSDVVGHELEMLGPRHDLVELLPPLILGEEEPPEVPEVLAPGERSACVL